MANKNMADLAGRTSTIDRQIGHSVRYFCIRPRAPAKSTRLPLLV